MREEPVMLTEAELDLPSNPVHEFPAPRRMHVWICYPSSAYRVKGHASAWTKTAIKVSFFELGIKIQREKAGCGSGWAHANWTPTRGPNQVGSVTPADPHEL